MEKNTVNQPTDTELAKERETLLREQVYDLLKVETEAIDEIDVQIRQLNELKKSHEENVKNIKQGNLQAVKRRAESYGTGIGTLSAYTWTIPPAVFYNMYVAGVTIKLPSGRTLFF